MVARRLRLEVAAREALAGSAELEPRGLAQLAWSLSRLEADRGGPLLRAVAEAALPRLPLFAPRDLASTVWALAHCQQAHVPLFQAVSDAAVSRACEFNAQDLANTTWAFATVSFRDAPGQTELARRALDLVGTFRQQELASTVWAFATFALADDDSRGFLDAMTVQVVDSSDDFDVRSLASIVWAVATLAPSSASRPPVRAMLTAVHECVETQLMELKPQDVAGFTWSFATLAYCEVSMMKGLADVTLRRLDEFQAKEVDMTVWALARGAQAVSSAADGTAREGGHGLRVAARSKVLATAPKPASEANCFAGTADVARVVSGATTKALVQGGVATPYDHGLALLEAAAQIYCLAEREGRGGDLALGALLGACESRALAHEQAGLLWRAASGAAASNVDGATSGTSAAYANLCAARLAQGGDAASAVDALHAAAQRPGFTNEVSERIAAALGLYCSRLPGQSQPPRSVRAPTSWRPPQPHPALGVASLSATAPRRPGWPQTEFFSVGRISGVRGVAPSKVARLLPGVLRRAVAGDAFAACRGIEGFAAEVLCPARQWLKIAGGEKAEVLRDILRIAPEGAILEIGTYVGYSSMAFAAVQPGRRVVSLEVQPEHAAVAQNLTMHAGVAHQIDVWTGHSSDVLERLPSLYEAVGGLHVGVVFMDQCGSRFWEDLTTIVASGMLAPGAMIVADNVLKPGAPLFLWHLFSSSDFAAARVISLEEFGMPGVEDWVAIAEYQPRLSPAAPPPGDGHGSCGSAAPMPPKVQLQAPRAPRLVQELEWRAREVRESAAGGTHSVDFDDWATYSARMRDDLAQLGITPRAVSQK